MRESFDLGDRVKIGVRPGCDGEFKYHGYSPHVNKLMGTVMWIEPGHEGHVYKVDTNDGHHGYYKADELTSVYDL